MAVLHPKLGRRRPFEWRAMLSALAVRNYRLYFFGQLVSVAGTWMQTVAQSFLVLRLTGSGTALGLATAARFLPMFVFGPLGGLVADRMDKRRVLYVTQSLSGLLAAVFAVLIGTDAIEMWMVYLLALALGVVNVFDNPARQSFIAEMVRTGEAVQRRHVELRFAQHGSGVRRRGGRGFRRRPRTGRLLCHQRGVVRGGSDLPGHDAQR